MASLVYERENCVGVGDRSLYIIGHVKHSCCSVSRVRSHCYCYCLIVLSSNSARPYESCDIARGRMDNKRLKENHGACLHLCKNN